MPTPPKDLASISLENWPGVITPGEIAALFRVDVKTVRRWEVQGKLEGFKTEGGHRRFKKETVWALFNREG